VFLHPVVYAGHVVHFGASRTRNVDALFFMLDWERYGFHKNHVGTRYAELVFLHPLDTLFFMLRRDRYGFHKKSTGACYVKHVFLHALGSAGHLVHSDASGPQNVNALFLCSCGTSMDLTKSAPRHVMVNMCFCIRGSHGAF
jgi:hypothetical protein